MFSAYVPSVASGTRYHLFISCKIYENWIYVYSYSYRNVSILGHLVTSISNSMISYISIPKVFIKSLLFDYSIEVICFLPAVTADSNEPLVK